MKGGVEDFPTPLFIFLSLNVLGRFITNSGKKSSPIGRS